MTTDFHLSIGAQRRGPFVSIEEARRAAAEWARLLQRGGTILDASGPIATFSAPRGPFHSVYFETLNARED